MSTVPAQLASRRQRASRATSGTLAAAAVASIALGALLFEGVAGERASMAPSARAGRATHEGLAALPLTAQGPVSAALGSANRAYRVTAARDGSAAVSAAQRLSVRFARAGVSLRSGATSVGLSLRAAGYGVSLRALTSVAPRVEGNRVLYERAGLSEWYANGPLGLEQGFTLARAPSGRSAGVLTLSMALSGNAHAALGSGGKSITFSSAGGPRWRYRGLRASDARGRALQSSLQLQRGRILLRVDTRGASYPLRIDPFIRQGEKLTVSGLSGPYGYVGMSVALSADGNTALIGAPADGEYRGAAFVFTRSGSTWTQQGEKLTGSGTVGEAWFGESVALSADGDTALIGGPTDNGAVGAAWVFTRSGSTWTQQGGKLTGGGESDEGYFGRSAALSADGNTALIGGYNDDEHHGAAWVFTRSGSTWSQQGEKLTGSGELGFFGWSVALSAEANIALIGEWGIGGGVGAAWVFTRTGSTWSRQRGPLTGGPSSGESWFGYSVALSSAGDTALIGAPHGDAYAGAAWVFTRSGLTWSQQGEPLTGKEEIGEGELGYSAALSANGSAALLGGRVDNGFHGAAWAFERSGTAWTQLGEKLTGSAESANREEFGWSAALSSGGDTALIGSPCDKACVGSVSAFVNRAAPTVVTGAASGVAQTSATLNAAVDPNGETVSECRFEYGTSLSYGSSIPCASSPGSGESPVAVSAAPAGLAEDATYHFRIAATNALGTSYGADQTLTTAAPEFGRCVQVGAGTGKYASSTCTSMGGKDRYEWDPGVVKGSFTTKITSGSVAIASALKGSKLTCTVETSAGEYTGLKTVGDVVLTLTGCERGGERCSSAGAAAGEIVTQPLEGALGVEKLGASRASDKIGLDLFPSPGTGAFMEFSCAGTSVAIQGSVIVPISADKMLLANKLKASASKGEQKPESFVAGAKDVLEESFDRADFEPTGLSLALTQTDEEAVEVNSVV